MALLQHDLGLNKMAKINGLKRRFFGFESDRSLARRVVMEMGKMNPMLRLAEGLGKIFAPRVCIREEFNLGVDGLKVRSEWVYHYSDGSIETVTGSWL